MTANIDHWRDAVSVACRELKASEIRDRGAVVALSDRIVEQTGLPDEEAAWLQLELADTCITAQSSETAALCIRRAEQRMTACPQVTEDLLAGLADAWIQIERYGKAIPHLRAITALGTDDTPSLSRAGIWSNLGDCFLMADQPSNAFDCLATAAWHAERAGASEAAREHVLAQLTVAADRASRVDDGIRAIEDMMEARTVLAVDDPLAAISPLMRIADLASTPGRASTCLAAGLRSWRLLSRTRIDGRLPREFPIGARVLGVIGRARRLLDQPRAAEAALAVAEGHLRQIPDADPEFMGEILEHRSLLARDRADYDLALALAAEHAELIRRHVGQGFDSFRILNRYGTLLYDLAKYPEAEAVIRDALAHAPPGLVGAVDRANVTTNLAKALVEMGRYAAAVPEMERARALLVEADALGSAAEAALFMALSQWFRGQGRNADARDTAERAVAILSRIHGPADARLATPLSFVAGIDKDEERWNEADAGYLRVLNLEGLTRLQRANALQNRVLPLLQASHIDEANRHAQEAFSIKAAIFGESHERLTVARYMLGLVAQHRGDHAAALAHWQAELDQELSIYGLTHEQVARTRVKIAAAELGLQRRREAEAQLALVLDSQLQRLRELFRLNSDEQRIIAARDWLYELDAFLSVSLFHVDTESDIDRVYAQVIARKGLVTEVLSQERFNPAVGPAGDAAVTPQQVRSLLPTATTLVDIVACGSAFLDTGPSVSRRQERTRSYVAFVLAPDRQARIVDLGDAMTIDRAVAIFWSALHGRRPMADIRAAGQKLRGLIWDPLQLDGCPRVIISTDGALNQVAFAALPAARSDWLIDSVEIAHVPSARSLAAPANASTVTGQSPPCVIAAPDFGPPMPGGWDDLDGAFMEGVQVAERLGVPVTTGKAATAAALTSAAGPRILHIATHGFYLPRANKPPELMPPPLSELMLSVDPLKRAALVFAGANGWLTGEPGPGEVSPIVTARAIADLALDATDLVVLSACQTGLGDAEPFDGAHGLRRAFLAAGARRLIVSLWNANDRPTAFLMDRLYAAICDGRRAGAALREAARATAQDYPHPSDWAPFIHISHRGVD